MQIFKLVLVLSLVACLSSCSVSLDDYQDSQPVFDLKDFFNGPITAHGIVQDYSNKLTRRFCVDIIGSWDDNKGQLHETFYYADGEEQIRIWQLTIADDGGVTGTAGDVIGTASGRAQGTAFNWQYTLRVPIGETEYDFAIDDWMFMLDRNKLMNRSYMRKFGITVADISIYFDKALKGCKK